MRASHRIIALLAAIMLLPFLPATALLAVAAAAAVAVALTRSGFRASVMQSVWRLRWLLGAVVLIYAFFSPGDDIRWLEAAGRGALLVTAVIAVRFALRGVPAAELAAGLAGVLAPLALLGIRTERFSHRLVLTLDAVPEVQALIARTPAPAGGGPLARLTARAAAVIDAVEKESPITDRLPQEADGPSRAAPS